MNKHHDGVMGEHPMPEEGEFTTEWRRATDLTRMSHLHPTHATSLCSGGSAAPGCDLCSLHLISVTAQKRRKRKDGNFAFVAERYLKCTSYLFVACSYPPFAKSGFESFPGALLKWPKHPGKGRIVAMGCSPYMELQQCFLLLAKEHLRLIRKSL